MIAPISHKAGYTYLGPDRAAQRQRLLEGSAKTPPMEIAAPALALLTDQPATLPAERSFRLLASSLNGAERHTELMTGTALAAGGTTRREMTASDTDPDRVAEL